MILGATELIGSAIAVRLKGDGRHLILFSAMGVEKAAPARIALDLAGREPLAFEDIVVRYRGWLCCNPARQIGWWFAFDFPAFAAVAAIFCLMIKRPGIAL